MPPKPRKPDPFWDEVQTIAGSPMYCDLDGNPISLRAWTDLVSADFETTRRVALTDIGDWRVSTVWMGINHQFSTAGPPLIFETMIFEGGEASDLYCDRYSTRREAQIGHDVAVAWLKSHLSEIQALTEGDSVEELQHEHEDTKEEPRGS